ncbi:MAG: CopD family protein [Candidatus Margulisiibacteriota bacterium]|nr:CopD family protein [Candidatus Margulisiibacteriota bacterium]
MSYLITKALHLIAVLAWSAGLFYIGRIFIYFVESNNSDTKNTLFIMAFRLNRYIILPASIIATLIGLHLIGSVNALSQPWFHLKATLLILLFGYQHVIAKFIKQLKSNTFNKSSKWCRVFNEVPIVLLTGIVFSVITKNIQISLIATGVVTALLALFFLISKNK